MAHSSNLLYFFNRLWVTASELPPQIYQQITYYVTLLPLAELVDKREIFVPNSILFRFVCEYMGGETWFNELWAYLITICNSDFNYTSTCISPERLLSILVSSNILIFWKRLVSNDYLNFFSWSLVKFF